MKHLLKGQIPREYQLDYDIIFTEQSATVYEKLILELRRLMAGHFNPSVTQLSNWLHSIHKHRRDRIRKRNSGKLIKDDRRMHKNARLGEVSIFFNLYCNYLIINLCKLFNRKKTDKGQHDFSIR